MSDESAGQAPPESDAEHEARLMRFYSVDTRAELLRAMERHIDKNCRRNFSDRSAERTGTYQGRAET